MDFESGAMESLDSLWFFSNVLSKSRTSELHGSGTDQDIPSPVKKVDSSAGNPFENHKIPAAETSEDDVSPKNNEGENGENGKKSNAGEVVARAEVEEVKTQVAARRRRRRRRRKLRSKRHSGGQFPRRMIDLGEPVPDTDLCFDFLNVPTTEQCVYGCNSSWVSENVWENYYQEMPSLEDGIAMKEHLKSWAYAVACAVK